ncbi:MAG: NUDIX domain-containing protein [Streptococcaceae bacterium]|jgi:8-oxo-dGTP pyrophosphatase MutT (NUDIX family)|nr:NUDIX domain-containing protein [Streptococcaceae bacterium]
METSKGDVIRQLDFLENHFTLVDDIQKLNKIRKLIVLTNENLLKFENEQLHLSASAVVFVKDKILFIEHPYLKTKLLPAGHVEEGENILAAAIREFTEETGYFAVANDDNPLLDVNLIKIPTNLTKGEFEHYHIDFRYQLTLASQFPKKAELPTFLLSKKEAAPEFKKYFDMLPF